MQKEDSCYYKSYSTCTCAGTRTYDQKCIGKECENYISEGDYFMQSMSGKDMDKRIKLAKSDVAPQKKYDLSLEKSKKAKKKEAKIEKERNAEGMGFSLKDDPRFKDLFK